MLTYKTDDIIIECESPNHTFFIIADGTVSVETSGHSFLLRKGDIVGIFDIISSSHTCTYRAASSCALIAYSFQNQEEFLKLLGDNPDLCQLLVSSLTRSISYIMAAHAEDQKSVTDCFHYLTSIQAFYQSTCRSMGLMAKVLPFMEGLSGPGADESLPFWMNDYYYSMMRMLAATEEKFSPNFVYGFLEKSNTDMEQILSLIVKLQDQNLEFSSYLLNEDHLDLFDLYTDLFFRARSNGFDATMIHDSIQTMIGHLRSLPSIDKTLVVKRVTAFQSRLKTQPAAKDSHSVEDSVIEHELAGALNTILSYADTVHATAAEFKKYLDLFTQLPDRSSFEPDVASIRSQLTRLFYLVYGEVFQNSLQTESIPTIIKMFLNFGFVDLTLCGHENALQLYHMAETYHGNREQGIYTIYEWVREIYSGKKQPSRNEFDQDYTAYIRRLSQEGKIDKEAERNMSDDALAKVLYELQNMIPSVNKITSGHVLTFCPVLLEENICKPLEDMYVKPQDITAVLDRLTAIDYSAFYHDSIFEDMSLNIKETIYTDIRPDIILMPNVGSHGILWQEIEGMRRQTPARMMLSAFHIENIDKTFVSMIGAFRWEMCKRSQGVRWNDVTSHCLTSEYFDYIQFFQKNRELSYDTKEKIKVSLKKYRNNFRDMFISDYSMYILYEATGSCRLNKVARSILFQYCPFSKKVCETIKGNAIYSDTLHLHKIRSAQALHRLDQIILRYQNGGKLVPEEILKQKELLSK